MHDMDTSECLRHQVGRTDLVHCRSSSSDDPRCAYARNNALMLHTYTFPCPDSQRRTRQCYTRAQQEHTRPLQQSPQSSRSYFPMSHFTLARMRCVPHVRLCNVLPHVCSAQQRLLCCLGDVHLCYM